MASRIRYMQKAENKLKKLKINCHILRAYCTHEHMYTRAYICTHVHMHTWTYVHMYTCAYICAHLHRYSCTNAHMNICTHVHQVVFFSPILLAARSKARRPFRWPGPSFPRSQKGTQGDPEKPRQVFNDYLRLTRDRCYDFLNIVAENSAKNCHFWFKTKLNYAKFWS
jgi:hypothetical protein